MADCEVPCFGSLQADNLAAVVKTCAQNTVTISVCRIESAALAPLRAEAHPDVRLAFSGVSGTIDLQGAQVHDLAVLGSRLDRLDLHDATVDRVRVAPSSESMTDAYAADTPDPQRVAIDTVDARGCHVRTFALLATRATDVDLRHMRVDEALDLTWTEADTLSLRFADVPRLEAARLTTHKGLDLFGARLSQASLARGSLQSLNAERASVERVLSLSNTQIAGDLDGYWFSAGAVVFSGFRAGSMDLRYSHLGLVDVDSVAGFATGPVKATGMHVDSISGDVLALTSKIDPATDPDGALHSVEAALRNGGRYGDANTVAFHGSWFTAGVAGKVPGQLAVGVIGFFAACFLVAAWCCRPAADDRLRVWKVLLCALDIVLPSFVDIGALTAWTDYGERDKKEADVKIEGGRRTVAFIMRILGTVAFTYLLLYVTTLRG